MAQDAPYAEFAALMAKLKDERGITQSAIARDLEVAPSQPSGWSGGRSRPRPENLERMAEVYGLDLNELQRMCGYRTGATEFEIDPAESEILAVFRRLDEERRAALRLVAHSMAAVQPLNRGPDNRRRQGQANSKSRAPSKRGQHNPEGEDPSAGGGLVISYDLPRWLRPSANRGLAVQLAQMGG